jgi:protein-S-isoprenylcysteine O-methyltransferase Ste14
MKISEHFNNTGPFFFRWRGYLFLFLVPLILLSFVGFTFPFGSHVFDLFWEIGCFLVSLLGLSVRVFTVGSVPRGTSERSTKKRKADVLNTAGMYSIVRHPLYLGNYLMVLGISLFSRTWFLPLIVSLAFVLHYERVIFAEEEYLESKFGDEFLAWAARVPIIIPRFGNYQPPKLSFSWKFALRREFYGLFGLITAFFVLDTIADFIVYRRVTFDPFWGPLFIFGLVFFFIMRILKKNTNLLKVDGR